MSGRRIDSVKMTPADMGLFSLLSLLRPSGRSRRNQSSQNAKARLETTDVQLRGETGGHPETVPALAQIAAGVRLQLRLHDELLPADDRLPGRQGQRTQTTTAAPAVDGGARLPRLPRQQPRAHLLTQRSAIVRRRRARLRQTEDGGALLQRHQSAALVRLAQIALDQFGEQRGPPGARRAQNHAVRHLQGAVESQFEGRDAALLSQRGTQAAGEEPGQDHQGEREKRAMGYKAWSVQRRHGFGPQRGAHEGTTH